MAGLADLLSVTERTERLLESETCQWKTATTNDGNGSVVRIRQPMKLTFDAALA